MDPRDVQEIEAAMGRRMTKAELIAYATEGLMDDPDGLWVYSEEEVRICVLMYFEQYGDVEEVYAGRA